MTRCLRSLWGSVILWGCTLQAPPWILWASEGAKPCVLAVQYGRDKADVLLWGGFRPRSPWQSPAAKPWLLGNFRPTLQATQIQGSSSLSQGAGKPWGAAPGTSHSQAGDPALHEPGEVSVCNMVFTRQRGFLSAYQAGCGAIRSCVLRGVGQ